MSSVAGPAWIQHRIGPNRVGPLGALQPLADGVKFIFKEEFVPESAPRAGCSILAPAISAMGPALMSVAGDPLRGGLTIGEIDGTPDLPLDRRPRHRGGLWVVAIGGLGIYGVILGGWAANNKFSLFGGLRASAQMIARADPGSGRPGDRPWRSAPSADRHRGRPRTRSRGCLPAADALGFFVLIDRLASPRPTGTPSTSPRPSPKSWPATT